MSNCTICNQEYIKTTNYNRCLNCRNAIQKKYRLKNSEKIKAGQRDHYLRNKEKVKAHVKEYALKNQYKIQQYRKSHYEKNKERIKNSVKQYALNNQNKVKSYKKKYYLKNKDYIKNKVKKWNARNPEKVFLRSFLYKLNNRKKLNEDSRRRYQINKEKTRFARNVRCRNYFAKKNNAVGFHVKEDILKKLSNQASCCNACKCDISQYFEIDHIEPISKGGSNWPSNLQLLCLSCNRSKGSKTMEDFLNTRINRGI